MVLILFSIVTNCVVVHMTSPILMWNHCVHVNAQKIRYVIIYSFFCIGLENLYNVYRGKIKILIIALIDPIIIEYNHTSLCIIYILITLVSKTTGMG